ncbi:MAG TPA: hypothetical protein ENI86_05280 [Acidimicrobiales bacterium]|nr:hypothetical protein [Acidimicrobiales bacterium]
MELEVRRTRSSPSLHSSVLSASQSAWQRLWYEEPAQQAVSEVTTNLSWGYTGTCVTWMSGSGHDDWLELTGWRRVAFSTASSGTRCDPYVWYRTSGTYKNPYFCATIDTWTKYYYNTVRGYPDGSKGYSASAKKWGGCSALLSYHRSYG